MRLVLAAGCVLAAMLAAGCASAEPSVIVASEDLGLVCMEHNGVSGWWAPQATMAELMQARRDAAPPEAETRREALEMIAHIPETDLYELEKRGQYMQDHSIYGGGVLLQLVGCARTIRASLADSPGDCGAGQDGYGAETRADRPRPQERTGQTTEDKP